MSSIYMGYNPAANQSAREMNKNNAALNKALTSLTTGNRINTAGDDAAGYTIGKNMEVKISGMQRAVRNANDSISAFQVLGGSLKGLSDRVARLQTLATQAHSDFNAPGDIINIKKEVTSLISGIDSDAKQANFNGVNLMEKKRDFAIQVGDSASDMITLNVEAMTVKDLGLDKIDFSVFSKASAYYSEGTVGGKELSKGVKIDAPALITANAKASADTTLAGFFNANGSTTPADTLLELATDDTIDAIFTAVTAKDGKIFALKDAQGNVVADKIVIENDDKSGYAILTLTTTITAGVASVGIGAATTKMSADEFNQSYKKNGSVINAASLQKAVEPKIQEVAGKLALANADIKFEPNQSLAITAGPLAAGDELRQAVDGSGKAIADKFLLVKANGDVFDVKVKAQKLETTNKRSMTLEVTAKNTDIQELDENYSSNGLLGKLKEAYDHINEVSSTVGATITGLNNTIESLSTNIANTSDAHARIIKADIIETYSEAASRKVQQQAIAQAMQMSNSLTEIALQAMR
nr:flagellin [uncultured Moellerella sp.]